MKTFIYYTFIIGVVSLGGVLALAYFVDFCRYIHKKFKKNVYYFEFFKNAQYNNKKDFEVVYFEKTEVARQGRFIKARNEEEAFKIFAKHEHSICNKVIVKIALITPQT